MKSGVLYLYGGIWEEGEKDFKLRGRIHLFSFCSTNIRKRYIGSFTFYNRLILKTEPRSYFRNSLNGKRVKIG
jgi:hypothetical protein